MKRNYKKYDSEETIQIINDFKDGDRKKRIDIWNYCMNKQTLWEQLLWELAGIEKKDRKY